MLPAGDAVLIGLAALAVALLPLLGRFTDHFNTLSHEGAHAGVAALLGITVLGVFLYADNSGSTYTFGPRGLRRILVSFSGYLGPSVFGIVAARLISAGHGIAVLWIAIILLGLLMLLVIRSFGSLSVPAVIALLVLILHGGHARTELIVAYAIAWLLLLSGFRTAVKHGADAGDAYNLNELTRLPRQLWALLWLAGTFAALLYGGRLLVLGH